MSGFVPLLVRLAQPLSLLPLQSTLTGTRASREAEDDDPERHHARSESERDWEDEGIEYRSEMGVWYKGERAWAIHPHAMGGTRSVTLTAREADDEDTER